MNELDQLPPDDTENCCLACNARGFNCEAIFRESSERCCAGCRHRYSTQRPVDFWQSKALAAQVESADWATIEEWRRFNSHEFMLQGLDSGEWRLKIINWGPKCERRGEFEGARAEVIQRAAEWCRADDKRTHEDRLEENLELVREVQTTEPAEETG